MYARTCSRVGLEERRVGAEVGELLFEKIFKNTVDGNIPSILASTANNRTKYVCVQMQKCEQSQVKNEKNTVQLSQQIEVPCRASQNEF